MKMAHQEHSLQLDAVSLNPVLEYLRNDVNLNIFAAVIFHE